MRLRASIRVKKIGVRYFKISLKQGEFVIKKSFSVDKKPEKLKITISELTNEFKEQNFVVTEKELYKALKAKGGDYIPTINY